MKRVQLLLVCLVFSAAAFAADKVIKLPQPNLNRTGAVLFPESFRLIPLAAHNKSDKSAKLKALDANSLVE